MRTNITIGTFDWEMVFRDRTKLAKETPWQIQNIDKVELSGNLAPLLDIEAPRIAIIGESHISGVTSTHIDKIVGMLSACTGDDTLPIVITTTRGDTAITVQEAAKRHHIPAVSVADNGLDIAAKENLLYVKKFIDTPGNAMLSQFPSNRATRGFEYLDQLKTIIMMADAVIITSCSDHNPIYNGIGFAQTVGIPVLAIPGDPLNNKYAGNNGMIKSGAAKMIQDFNEINKLFGQ